MTGIVARSCESNAPSRLFGDDGKLAEDSSMAKTREALATKIDEPIDRHLEPVDRWLEESNKRFEEMMAYLSVKIGAVRSKLDLVLERMDELQKRHDGNSAALERGERPGG
jgi:HEAT repeat protein